MFGKAAQNVFSNDNSEFVEVVAALGKAESAHRVTLQKVLLARF